MEVGCLTISDGSNTGLVLQTVSLARGTLRVLAVSQ
jgi:hypothetical protein